MMTFFIARYQLVKYFYAYFAHFEIAFTSLGQNWIDFNFLSCKLKKLTSNIHQILYFWIFVEDVMLLLIMKHQEYLQKTV